jgi:hypothetical protein
VVDGMDCHPKQRGFIEVDTVYQSIQTAREFSLSLMTVWKFKFETAKVIEGNKHLEISVEAENWPDASGDAAREFMKQNPEYQNGDFVSVTAVLISVEN